MLQWVMAGAFALLVHGLVALPFLPKPEVIEPEEFVELPEEIGVRLAPIVQPPEDIIPPEPEPEKETPVIEERAYNSPPPKPPAKPRKIPDLPDIQPQAVPELWLGKGSSNEGQMSLEEYLFLQEWLAAARSAVLKRLRYPEDARLNFLTGNAKVIVVADRDGRIVEWRFLNRTGERILDGEIARAIRSIRRLPAFPEGTRYDTLSYLVIIRFELVRPDGSIMSAQAAAVEREQQTTSAEEPIETLSAGQMAQCASSAAQLVSEREIIDTMRVEIEANGADYQEKAERYHRQRREPPRSLERQLKEYNDSVAAYDQRVAAFQQRAGAYQSLCKGGSTTFDIYAQACGAYVGTDNPYCAAFGVYWQRLQPN